VSPESLDLTDADVRDAVSDRLGELYAGRPALLGPGILAAYPNIAAWLQLLDCPVLVVTTARGTGPVPTGVRVVEIDSPPATSATEELRALDHLARTLPPEALAELDALDPDRRGFWWCGPFVTNDEPVAGRPVLFGRSRRQYAMEDKLFAERLWDEAGIAHAPSRIVPVDRDALAAATTELATDLGAVWSGDARDGFNGGGNYVRWVRTDDGQDAAYGFFAARCDQVRVQPFLDGVACSIHGVVLPDGTATFRPVEIVTLRNRERLRLVYGGLSTWWDPPPADREYLREVARTVGDHLARSYGYRGFFGIDGVLTEDGFLPTEINTRMPAGATTLAKVDARLLHFVQSHLVSGLDPGITSAELETLLPLMDAERIGDPKSFGPESLGGAVDYPVAVDELGVHRAETETGNVFAVADNPSGYFATIRPCSALALGDRLAPITVGLMRHLDEHFGTDHGRLEVAPDVREA
jgi:hypothetical protein